MTHPEAHHPRATHLLLPVPFGPVGAPGAPLYAGDLWVAGWSLSEASGAGTATFQLIDGNDGNGVPMGPIVTLPANGLQAVMLGGHLLTVRTGLFVKVTAGTVTGAVYAADK